MVRSRRRWWIAPLAVALAVTLAAAGCGGTDGDDDARRAGRGARDRGDRGLSGVTDDEIRFAAFGVASNNPLGTCILDCYVDGIEAHFAYRNREGGVHGRDLVLAAAVDDRASQDQLAALEVVSADVFGAFSAALVANGWATVAETGMPLYTWAIHVAEAAGRESIFGHLGVGCVACPQRATLYAATLAGATRVAAVGYGITQSSKDCVESQRRSVELYADETGVSLAFADDELEYGLPDGIAAQVSAMKEAGVDFVITCIDLNGVKTLARELDRQGMGHVPLLHQNTYDQEFVARSGGLFDGDLVITRFRPFESTRTGALAEYFEWMDATGGRHSELAMVGWINADLAYQGLVRAGRDVGRAEVIAATNQLTAYTAGGLIAPVDWSRQHVPPTPEDPTSHGYAQECVGLVRVVAGSFQLVGEPDRPFLCWSNTSRDWAEPQPTDFG